MNSRRTTIGWMGMATLLASMAVTAQSLALPAIVKPVAALASSELNASHSVSNLINGSGLSADLVTGNAIPAVYPTCTNVDSSTFWHAGVAAYPHTVTVDLGKTYALTGFHLWNFNAAGYTWRGANTATVSVSVTGTLDSVGGYTNAALTVGSFTQASGLNTYAGENYWFSQVVFARFVRITITADFNSDGWAGLSEIRFVGENPPQGAPRTVNVDFGYGASACYSGTAMAPDTGTDWSAVVTGPYWGVGTGTCIVATHTLHDSLGNLTSVSFTMDGVGLYDCGPGANAAPALMNDFSAFFNGTTATMTFAGLVPGRGYDLYLYSENGVYCGSHPSRASFTFGGTTQNIVNSGTNPSGFVLGDNYTVFRGLTASESGEITGTMTSDSPYNGVLNGFQLIMPPAGTMVILR